MAKFSSPLFGDMFLLRRKCWFVQIMEKVFVSFIQRYVLTRLGQRKCTRNVRVFVSFIRRYVLTPNADPTKKRSLIVFSSPLFGDMFLLPRYERFRWGNGNLFSSPLFGDMFLLDNEWVEIPLWLEFSSPLFGDMFLLSLEILLMY